VRAPHEVAGGNRYPDSVEGGTAPLWKIFSEWYCVGLDFRVWCIRSKYRGGHERSALVGKGGRGWQQKTTTVDAHPQSTQRR
jgi:hypothetical protein